MNSESAACCAKRGFTLGAKICAAALSSATLSAASWIRSISLRVSIRSLPHPVNGHRTSNTAAAADVTALADLNFRGTHVGNKQILVFLKATTCRWEEYRWSDHRHGLQNHLPKRTHNKHNRPPGTGKRADARPRA